MAGDGWIVAAMASWALYALLQKKWPSPLSATARLAAIHAGGVLVYAALAAWGVLNEPLGRHHMAGAALILPGVCLVTCAAGAPRPSPAAAEVG